MTRTSIIAATLSPSIRCARHRLAASVVAASLLVGGLLGPAGNALAATPPSAPQNVSLTGAPGSVVATWAAPATNGGSSLTGYTLNFKQVAVGTVQSASVPSSSTTFRLDHLSQGTTWVAQVCATNALGSTCSAWTGSAAVLPPVVPTAPTNLTFAGACSDPRAQQNQDPVQPVYCEFNWNPPAFDGGVPVSGYKVTECCRSDGSALQVSTSSTSVAIYPGVLTPCYSVAVRAVNAVGTGPATPSVTACTV
jgi:hypothetical protein